MALVLIGPPAAGKSRIGKKLARKLDIPFIDTDKEIVREHGPISEIFAEHGEPHFRALERAVVVDALEAGTAESGTVVAFGGGAVLDQNTQADLAGHHVVLLTVDPEVVADRLSNGKRPLVSTVDAWIALVEPRMATYRSLADFTIDTSNLPTEFVAETIAAWHRGGVHSAAEPVHREVAVLDGEPGSVDSATVAEPVESKPAQSREQTA
jgi:shikimate kinase